MVVFLLIFIPKNICFVHSIALYSFYCAYLLLMVGLFPESIHGGRREISQLYLKKRTNDQDAI